MNCLSIYLINVILLSISGSYFYGLQIFLMIDSRKDKSTRGIGGTTLIGVGVGLAVVNTTILLLVGTFVAGIGLGIVITAILTDVQ